MACVLTTGFTLDCRKSLGGVKEVYIRELSAIATSVVSAGVVSAMTLTSGKFFKYDLRNNTSEAKADNAGDIVNGAGYLMQSVQIQLDKFDTAKRNEIRILASVPVVIIVKDKANAEAMVYGITNGLDLTTGTGGSGKEANSLNGFNLTFTGEELDYPPTIPAALLASLLP